MLEVSVFPDYRDLYNPFDTFSICFYDLMNK